MGYRIPDDELVLEAIEEVLVRRPLLDSQRALGERVRQVLQQEDPNLRVSDARVRRLAVDEGLVDVRVRTGTTDQPARERCPVCGEPVERKLNRTLDGGETVVGTECTECPYSTGHHHEVPLRYHFVRAKGPRVEGEGPF